MKKLTSRRFQMEATWKDLNKKAMISMDELFELMDQVGKLMQNYDNNVKSRDQWKKKYQELKKK